MKRSIVLLAIIFLSVTCSRKEPPTSPTVGSFDLIDYIPLKVDNTWTYSTYTVNTATSADTAWSTPIFLSIFQTNVLIGGQPNAFVVRTDGVSPRDSYLAFCFNGRTILHYLGDGSTFPIENNVIPWIPGDYSATAIGSHHTQSYHIVDRSGSSHSFSILRPPDPSFALATMTAPDTVQIKGV
jgi:hypothetical protein